MHNRDYFKLGRKVEDMGLDGMSLEEIKNYVIDGEIYTAGGVVA